MSLVADRISRYPARVVQLEKCGIYGLEIPSLDGEDFLDPIYGPVEEHEVDCFVLDLSKWTPAEFLDLYGKLK